MPKKWRLTDRTRTLLTLELAMVLPAAALMAFSIYNLKHIQHSEAIEAVLQRELNNVLRYAQKKSWEKGYNMVLPIRQEFPTPGDGSQIKAKLGRVLSDHPEFSYAALYDKKADMLVTSMQPGHTDAIICGYTQDEMDLLAKWLPLDSPHMVSELRKMEDNEHELVMFYGDWNPKQHTYWNVAYFIPPGVSKDREVLGLVAFDPDYLRKTFLPAVMKDVLTSKSGMKADDAQSWVLMIHPTKDDTPWVTSGNWDGRKPEVERQLMWFLDNLTIAIKYQGTTIAQIGNRILRYDYLILGALSGLMIGGIWLTYRNISREMKLARLKSDFVANVSHELRTPLALIRLYAETLELGRLTAKEKYQEYFRIIREESERLSALINNILDFSRIEAGRKEYEFKETDLPELVRSTLDSYRFQLEQNGFAFEENIAGDIPPVNVDREAIARSLLNLVNNALKYSKDQKFIGVSLYRANGSVKLEVRDKGIGIPPAEQEKIFEKFYRCGDPLVHNIKGSGLGLSLVRHIARAHGGDVLVESAPDKGSKFTIELPLDPSLRTGAAIA
jgi:signal transduction histidine kinase